tara:strand:- start:65 stop:562 length:498 start_codon:yes stop_codon:yes gene_type:complete
MKIKNNWFWILGILSLISIFAALTAEFVFNLEPCSMCLKQRHPYYFIILIFFISIFLKWQHKIWFYIGVQISSFYGAFYAIWHVGIENNILSGPTECSAELDVSNDVSILKAQILSKPVINCEEVIWSFFGISAASVNSFILILIFIFNAIYIFKNYDYKKNKII